MRALLVTSLLLAACHTVSSEPTEVGVTPAPTQAGPESPVEIDALLDAWHRAASEADEAAYLGAMTDDAVFLGTDATERWSIAEFREYVHRYFTLEGRGWTYVPRDRHVMVDGDVAWFDELLDNEGYGELRGTGVLQRTDAGWRLAHYNMTFTIPNEVGRDVVDVVRSAGAREGD